MAGMADGTDRDRFPQSSSELRQMERTINDLGSKVDLVKSEQVHLHELVDARFRTVEKAQELQSVKLDSLARDIVAMGSAPSNTPSGRILEQKITFLEMAVQEQEKTIAKQIDRIDSLMTWRSEFLGAFGVVRWLSALGATMGPAGFGLTLFRMLKLIP